MVPRVAAHAENIHQIPMVPRVAALTETIHHKPMVPRMAAHAETITQKQSTRNRPPETIYQKPSTKSYPTETNGSQGGSPRAETRYQNCRAAVGCVYCVVVGVSHPTSNQDQIPRIMSWIFSYTSPVTLMQRYHPPRCQYYCIWHKQV